MNERQPDHEGKRVVLSLDELETEFRKAIERLLTGRLAYYLAHLPKEEEKARVTRTYTEGGNVISYAYGQEVLLVVDMRNPRLVKFNAWERITEAEVDGSEPGPTEMHRIVGARWDEFVNASELKIIKEPPPRKRR